VTVGLVVVFGWFGGGGGAGGPNTGALDDGKQVEETPPVWLLMEAIMSS